MLTPKVISPALQCVRRRRKLQRQLGILRARTSNLLNACGQLLKGDTPEETVLYQLFSAYGGEHYEDIRADVHEWLRCSQEALNDAFDLRQKLLDPAVQEKRPLEQQEINDLQKELEVAAKSVAGKVGQCKSKAKALPAAAKTAKMNQLVRQVTDGFSRAKQVRAASTGLEDRALAKALRAAIAAYEKVSQQADQALQQIAADRNQYESYRTAAREAVRMAQTAIQRAERAVRDRDARAAGQHALQRAKTALPMFPTRAVSKQALSRLRKQAEEAQRYAEQAERQARQKIRATQAERDRQRRRAQRQRPTVSPKRPGVKVSSKRPSSGGESRQPSSRGESRRPSSRGESRRRSSRGSSRRR
ncbi:MAG TPA: hypothetical protein EYP49_03220 [Anaerolineae bacterium]|nr:hypothetical protein [Anaerolineae bacterium]